MLSRILEVYARPDFPEKLREHVVLSIVALLVESVSTSDGWSLAGYRALTSTGEKGALQVSGWDAAVNSLKVAVDATLLALAIGLWERHRRLNAREEQRAAAPSAADVLGGLAYMPVPVAAGAGRAGQPA